MDMSDETINNGPTSVDFEQLSNLDSAMTLLKTLKIPHNIQPMQSVALSTVQMFTASFVAMIQSISKQQSTIEHLTMRIEQLEGANASSSSELPTKMPRTPMGSINFYSDKFDAIEKRLSLLEDTSSDNVIAGSITGERQMVTPIDDIDKVSNSQLNNLNSDRIDKMEHQIEIVTKKLTEMVKRFKKEHSKKHNLSDVYNEIDAARESFAETLMNHESELEGIINSILDDITTNKESIEAMSDSIDQISTKFDSVNLDTISSTSEKITALHVHMKKVISNLNHVKSFCKRQGMTSMSKKIKHHRTNSLDFENMKKTLSGTGAITPNSVIRERSRSSTFLTFDDTKTDNSDAIHSLPKPTNETPDIDTNIWLTSRPVTRRRPYT